MSAVFVGFPYTPAMKALRSILLLAFGCCLGYAGGAAASLPIASPPVFQFKPILDVYPQAFAITVDNSSRTYIGHNDGVLIYDGEYWQLLPLPNQDIVRSLGYDKVRDRVYVGGYDALGYLERTPTGLFRYYDLTYLYADFLDGELFADIWRIQVAPDAIYFVGLEHLFRYDPDNGEVQAWKHEGSFGPIAFFQGKTMLQFRGEGFKYYNAASSSWVPIESKHDFSRIFLADMAAPTDEMLYIISQEAAWYQYDGEEFSLITLADKIPHRGSVTSAAPVTDDSIVLTTQVGKIVFVNVETGESHIVKVSTGFIPGVVISPGGDTLVVDDLGFYAVHWPARWKKIDSTAGLLGNIARIATSGDNTYALTSSGAFVSTPETDGFTQLNWTHYEAWDMLALPDGSVLFAESYEIRHILADGSINTIDHNTTARYFHQSVHNPDLVYVGTEHGFQVLQKSGETWVSIYKNDDMDALRVNSLVELSPDSLLIGSTRGGIRKLDISGLENGEVHQHVFDTEDGILIANAGNGAFIYDINREIVATTDSGVFIYEEGRFRVTEFDGLSTHQDSSAPFSLASMGNDLWAYLPGKLLRKNGEWVEEDIASMHRGAISTVDFVRGTSVVGGLANLLTFNPSGARTISDNVPISLTGATRYTPDAPTGVPVSLRDIEISSEDSRLTLRFAIPDYHDPEAVRYRSRLLPVEAVFGDWTANSEVAFLALAPGDYQLEVEAEDSLGQRSSMEVEIDVRPLWYETVYFRLLIASLFILLVYMLSTYTLRRRARQIARDRDRLELMVSERTRALESANQQLEKMAHLDGLTQIPNRRRLDDYLDEVWRQCVDRARVMAVAIVDVDHFKQYNDTQGHQAGDELLVQLARLLSRNLRRAEDLVARYGGEEFLVVLPGADEPAARQVAEDMRLAVEKSDLGVTISVGVHCNIPGEGELVTGMVEKADQALYEAKNGGRNQVVLV